MCAGACAVVGYHGAGQTNTVFCRNNTLVVEITTFEKPGDRTTIWRSNQQPTLQSMDYSIVWRTYPIGYEHLRPVPNITMYNGTTEGSRKEWNENLKNPNIILGRGHRVRIAALVEAHLASNYQPT
jgi:hypothetical protein